MDGQTELESKVAKTIGRILETPLSNEPGLKDTLSAISLTPYSFSEDLPKVMVVSMPLELLIYAKLHSKELMAALKKDMPKYMIVMRRVTTTPFPKTFNPIRDSENVLEDLVFPAIVAGRVNEVESRDEMTQIVYLDSKNQCWSKPELFTLEKLLSGVFEKTFKMKIFGSGF